MKNILITGSDGYVGTNLSLYLKKKKYEIYGYDKKTGTPAEFLYKTVGIKCDAIVHLAALPGIKACEDNIEDAIIDNISSAFAVFDLGKRENIPVVFLSSQAAKTPKESIYAMMKKTIEVQAELLNKNISNANIKVLRLTNVYGGQSYIKKKNTVIKKFIEAYRNKKPIIVDGNGEQTRDFIHVDDVCEYILRCIRMDKKEKIINPVDIGTGTETSIIDLAKMFVYNDHYIRYDKKSRSVGVESNFADITKAKKIFNFVPENKLEEYIKTQKERK